MNAYMLTLCAVGSTSIGQLLLKSASRRTPAVSFGGRSWAGLPWLAAGYSALLLAFVISTYVLRFLDASVVISLTALSYPFVVGLSRVFFAEQITRRQLSGLFLICFGVAFYNLA